MSYLFNTPQDRDEMLASIGVDSVERLFAEQIPDAVRLKRPLRLPEAMGEIELTRHMHELAARSQSVSSAACFMGGGAYDHFIPAAVDAIAGRGEFFTSYTPYQPEVSQGNLQVTFEYETLVCQLSGMDVSNASLYDGGSATLEAVLMCLAADKNRRRVLVSSSLNPQHRRILATYLQWVGAELVAVDAPGGATDAAAWREVCDDRLACGVVSLPNYFGGLEDVDSLVSAVKGCGGHTVSLYDPISVGLLRSPGDYGADVAVAEGQVLGNPLQFGGPYLGMLSCRESFIRRIPGRIAGQTVDRRGERCWVLTLQTREQHIRRDKATSNICTNQGLLALRATIYLSLLGPQGLRETAEHCLHATQYLKDRIAAECGGRFEIAFDGPSWREFTVRDRAGRVDQLLEGLRRRGILGGVPLQNDYPELADCFLVAVTEKRTAEEVDRYADALAAVDAAQGEVLHA